MKRISLIISLVMLFALSGTAQNGNFRFGLKLGPNFSWAGPCSEKTENHGADWALALESSSTII